MATAIRVLYAVAVGVFVALVVAFGSLTFFPDADQPDFPRTQPPRIAVPTATAVPVDGAPSAPTPTAEELEYAQAIADYDTAYERWSDARDAHRRRVLAGVTLAGAAFIVASIAVAGALDVLRVGLMLGGVLTVLWGLAYAAGSAGSGAAFVAAVAVLAALVALGHTPTRRRLRLALRLGEGDDMLARGPGGD